MSAGVCPVIWACKRRGHLRTPCDGMVREVTPRGGLLSLGSGNSGHRTLVQALPAELFVVIPLERAAAWPA